MMTRTMVTKSTRVLRKLRRMSPREIRCRCGQVGRRAFERRQWRQASRGGRSPSICSERLSRNAVRLVPGTARNELNLLRDTMPEFYERMKQRALAASQAIRSGAWRMLGHDFDLRAPIDWHRDPRSAYRWPRAFYADLPLYDLPDGVDVKYVWEAGRQQYAAELARAWLLAGDGSAAGLARALMLDWIKSNPQYEGVHWTSGLEVAMRAISWIWAVAALADWDGWQSGDLDRIAASLEEHATYLEHHFSFYSSPYNHLIGEATALLLIAVVLKDAPVAARWHGRATAVLREHGPRQFYGDGFCVEQATGYHFYTLGFLAQAVAVARSRGTPLDDLEAVARRAFLAGVAFRRPDGRWPAIGDVDSARSMPVHHEDFWSFDSLCQLGAALFEEPRLKRSSAGPGEETYWLLGAGGVERWRSLEAQAGRSRVHFRESGYVVAGNDRDWFLFDAGPIADGLHPDATPSVAHGHADVFQLHYVKDGKDVLLDAGMPFYGGGRNDWVDYFRSAAAHNTFEIEDAGPVRSAGPLAWSHEEPEPSLSARLTASAWLAAGRAEWSGGAVRVERHVLVVPGCGLWTADLIETDRPRTVRWHWNSLRPLAVNATEAADCENTGSGSVPFAVCASGGTLDVETIEPDLASPQARVCAGYGECEAAAVIRVTAHVERRMLVATRIGTDQAFEVRCGGHILAFPQFKASDVQDASVYSHEGVCWRIATQTEPVAIDESMPSRADEEHVQACPGGMP